MFIDTSGFLCVYEESEIFHQRAVKLFDSTTQCLTTSYILAEYTALAHVRGLARKHIVEFSEQVLSAKESTPRLSVS